MLSWRPFFAGGPPRGRAVYQKRELFRAPHSPGGRGAESAEQGEERRPAGDAEHPEAPAADVAAVDSRGIVLARSGCMLCRSAERREATAEGRHVLSRSAMERREAMVLAVVRV